jgi:hypothetical protein
MEDAETDKKKLIFKNLHRIFSILSQEGAQVPLSENESLDVLPPFRFEHCWLTLLPLST